MRVSAAFTLALMLAVTGAQQSLAGSHVAQDAKQHDRNPIVWFLSDLGNLLKTTATRVTQKSSPDMAPQPAAEKTDTTPEAENPVVADAAQPASLEHTGAVPEKPSIFSLFQDLANFFTAAHTNAAPAETEAETANDAAVADLKEPAVPVTEAKPVVPEVVAEPETSDNSADTTKKFRNPVAWLLSDLAELLQPTLEIDTQSASITTAESKPQPSREEGPQSDNIVPVKAKAGEKPADVSSLQTDQTNIQPEAKARIAEATAEAPVLAADAQPRNPVAWLIQDLARFLSPSDSVRTETLAVQTPEQETPVTASTPLAAETTIADTETPRAETSSSKAMVDPIADAAPWVPRPNNSLYDPNDRLFSANGAPLMVHNHAATSEAAPLATEVAEAPKQPVIRERVEPHPEVRNYRSLGYDPKAVKNKSDDDQGFLGNVLEQLLGTDPQPVGDEPLASKIDDRIVPEEKLDLGYISPDAKSPDPELTRIGEGPLANIDLYLGNKIAIDAPYNAAEFSRDSCIERSLHGSIFCLKDLKWPAEIGKSFSSDTAYVRPGEGVVRYENGKSSRIYAVFNAADFADVVKYMQHRFGPPQEREIGWMHMLEAPKLPNATFRWQAFSADRREIIILEVRNYDDLRRSFADMDHGMVRLYRSGSRPIFKHISTMDLMLMQRRRVASAPVEVNHPPKQQ